MKMCIAQDVMKLIWVCLCECNIHPVGHYMISLYNCSISPFKCEGYVSTQ